MALVAALKPVVTARIKKLQAEEAKLQDRRDELLDEATTKREQAAEVLINAQDTAKRIESDANTKASNILADLQVKVDRINQLLTAANSKLEQVTNDVTIKSAELANLEATIKDTKAGLLKLAGA